jgi:hypothetical protein
MDDHVLDQKPSARSFVLQRPWEKPPRDLTDDIRQLVHWLYTNNPFYVVSAALVFAGLWRSFYAPGSTFHAGSLAVGLSIYTTLLTATAWFLIRYGSLWQDVRTLLVLVVLMFLGISVSIDRLLTENLDGSSYASFGGLIFAIVLSEALLKGIRLRLPTAFRLPYYFGLALFFLYPWALSFWAYEPDLAATRWGMFGFSPLAGLLALTLVPAIRRGAAYVSNNGSPWPWPWYPWTLFGALGFGIVLRAYYLCISFHAIDGTRAIFRPYFLVPFLLALAWLLLETWRLSKSRRAKMWVLGAPLLITALALTATPGKTDDFGFLTLFHGTLGTSPLFATLLAVMFFYFIAWLRGVSEAWFFSLLYLVALSFCGRNTFNTDTLCQPQGFPILAVGIVLLVIGILRRFALCCLLGACCMIAAFWIDFRQTPFAEYHGAIPVHLFVVAMLAVGAIFRNEMGRSIQKFAAMTLLTLALIVAWCPANVLGDPPQAFLTFYPLSLTVLAILYGIVVQNHWYYCCAAGCLFGWLVVPGWRLFDQSRRVMVGMDYIACGAGSFLLALLVSLAKMGLFHRLYKHLHGEQESLATATDVLVATAVPGESPKEPPGNERT